MEPADVAIQIVNYKTKAFLDPLIAAILKDIKDSKRSIEINILDNASGDNLDDLAQKWKHHNVHVYHSDKNGGFGAGHNILAAKTTASYLLLLNPDMYIIEEHTVDRLIDTLEETNAAIVGPRLLTPKLRSDTMLRGLSLDRLKQQPWDHGRHTIWHYYIDNEVSDVAWVSGAVFLIRREQFKAIGGFDENFFLYYEEIDVCYRLRKKSARIIYNPHIQMLHYGAGAAKKSARHMLKSFFYFERKRLRNTF